MVSNWQALDLLVLLTRLIGDRDTKVNPFHQLVVKLWNFVSSIDPIDRGSRPISSPALFVITPSLVLLTRLIGDRDSFSDSFQLLRSVLLVLLTRLIGDRDIED
jgi:hypothetical protein